MRFACLLTCLWPLAVSAVAQGAPPDFQRDVQPILVDHCAQCHGVDAAERKAGLRLDLRDSALKGGDTGSPAIVPGDLEASELVRRITATDPGEAMPPKSYNKPLSPSQVETLKSWIKDGAPYAAHWAFTAPRKAPLPAGGPKIGRAHV